MQNKGLRAITSVCIKDSVYFIQRNLLFSILHYHFYKEKTFCLELAEKRLFTPLMRSCHVSYSTRPQYTPSHRIVAQIKPKSPSSEALTWRKQHQHQHQCLLSSDQRSSSPPLQPPLLRRSKPEPMHPNVAVCSDFLFIV